MTLARKQPVDRSHFAHRVAEEFEHAGLEYVLLHSSRNADISDSDVDIALSKSSLDAADALIRSGVFGSLVQCLHYDIPWCRYYVVRVDEAGRRYRAIDLACDPWGIGRYGHAVRFALERAQAVNGFRAPEPGAEVVYLVAKRARKGIRGDNDVRALATAFELSPQKGRQLLESCFGQAGESVADALEHGGLGVERSLEPLDASIARARASLPALGRRAFFAPIRGLRRVLAPSGIWLTLAGPDGVGKSTLGEALAGVSGGPFRRTLRLGQRRGYLPRPGRLLGRTLGDPSRPHAHEPSSRTGSLGRILYLGADAALGWPLRIALPRVRSTLVVSERGWNDLVVDPRRYRLSSGSSVVRALARVLPQPDLTLVLEAPAEVIKERKPELDVAEIRRQYERWRALAARSPERFAVVDASQPPEAVLEDALETIDEVLASRQRRLERARLALRCLGSIKPNGEPVTLVRSSGDVHWVLPAGRGTKGPLGAGIYRPTRKSALAKSLLLELAQRSGATRKGPSVALDPSDGLAPLVAAELGREAVELSAAVTGDEQRGQRALIAVRARGALLGFAKVSENGAALDRERKVLESLAASKPRFIVAPRPVASFEWNGCAVLLLEPVAARPRMRTDLGQPELEALAELASLSGLAPALGADEKLIPVHGDFAPWNCARLRDGRLSVWDWEEARLGLPLEDLFHWRMQRFALVGHCSAPDLVGGALVPDAFVRELCGRIGVEPEAAPDALRSVLERALTHSGDRRASARRQQALDMLEGSSP